jgi:hypothetical protein
MAGYKDAVERRAAGIGTKAYVKPKPPVKKPPVKPKAPAKKPPVKSTAKLTPDSATQMAMNATQMENEGSKALRLFQEDVARRNLQTNLNAIDRNALDAYKGIADDYGARGMLRSGGYFNAADTAAADITDARTGERNAFSDVQNQNTLQNLIGDMTTGYGNMDTLSAWLKNYLANKSKQIGA